MEDIFPPFCADIIYQTQTSAALVLQRVGLLVGCFGFKPVFQSISGRLPARDKNKREKLAKKERKTLAPTASAVGPYPKLVVLPGTGSLPGAIEPSDYSVLKWVLLYEI